jgi:hypothetical protein
MGRSWVSGKRMESPFSVPRTISFCPRVIATPMRVSPSSREMAMMPPRLGLPKAASSVFLTIPRSVARTRYPWSKVRTGKTEVIGSSEGI